MSDPEESWHDESNAFDDDTATTAYTTGSDYLVLTVDTTMECQKVRVYSAEASPAGAADIDIDLYYNDAWHNIWSGVVIRDQWVERFNHADGTQTVEKARVKYNGSATLYLYEFDFGELD